MANGTIFYRKQRRNKGALLLLKANGDLFIRTARFDMLDEVPEQDQGPRTILLDPGRIERRLRFLSGPYRNGHQRFRREESPFPL